MEADPGVQTDAASSIPLEAIKVDVEDEVDPLDAFMVDNSAQLVKEERQPDEEIDPLDAFMTSQVLPQEKLAVAPAPQIKSIPDASWVLNSRSNTVMSIKSTPVKLPSVGRRAVRRRYSSGESSSEDDKASSEEEDDAVSFICD